RPPSSAAKRCRGPRQPSWCCARTIGASGSAPCTSPMPRPLKPPSRGRARRMAVMVREAGKTLDNALGDVREAIDFLRYYAVEARRLFAGAVSLKGPTGETNTIELRGRGPFACISPWNFPLAIFTGQVAAALAAGNPVLAKPAEQTPIVAFLAVELLHAAG